MRGRMSAEARVPTGAARAGGDEESGDGTTEAVVWK